MREILYRGKGDTRFNSGGWVYGVPIKDYEGDWQLCTDCTKITVLPETIGEYTGLTDKNGKKIFEGDVLRIKGLDYDYNLNFDYTTTFFLVYHEFCVAVQSNIFDFLPVGFAYETWHNMGYEVEVIGNIHDNPELKD